VLLESSFWRSDPQGRLRLWNREDGRGRVLETFHLSRDGQARVLKDGYHRIAVRYDARGNQIEHAYFGLKGERVVIPGGYHRLVSRFNRQGRMVEQVHQGTAGELAFCTGCGFSRVLLRWDSRGNLAETLFLGRDNRPHNGKDGWARKRTTHDGSGNAIREEFWKVGPDGMLVPFAPGK
jgi:hypothetical protein